MNTNDYLQIEAAAFYVNGDSNEFEFSPIAARACTDKDLKKTVPDYTFAREWVDPNL